jgi:integrase
MRQGEIRALQAEDITIETEDTAFITVRHGYNPYDKLKTTKSKKERIVSAPASLCREILSFGKGNATGNGFVFWTPSSEKEPISAKAIDDYFDKALESAGITKQAKKARNISFHSLRHYYATVMSNAIGSDEARRLLGHSSLKMTDHYTHETEEHLLKLDEARQKAIPFAFPQKR